MSSKIEEITSGTKEVGGSPDSRLILKPEKPPSPDSVLSPLVDEDDDEEKTPPPNKDKEESTPDGKEKTPPPNKLDDDEFDFKTWKCEYQVYSDFVGISERSPYVQGTTLLKALPYNGIKDFYKDADECKSFREMIQTENIDLIPGVENDLSFLELTGCEPGNDFIETGPVIQVKSISIFNSNSDWKGSEIHGQIFVDHHDSQKRFFFYNTELHNPHVVSPDHAHLSSNHCLVAPVRKGEIQFRLLNSDGIQIFDTGFVLDHYSLKGAFECQENEIPFRGDHGYYAKMMCTIIPHAFVSDVVLTLIGPPDSGEETLCVDGEITANNFDFLTEKELKIASKSKSCTIYYVPKSRLTIAVPLFSSLLVDFNVTMGGKEFAIGKRQFFPSESTRKKTYFNIKDKRDYYFHLEVDWLSPNAYFQHFTMVRQPEMSNLYVEVFSIVLGGGSAPPSISGTIVIRDQEETVYIFCRNEFRPDKQWSERGRSRLSLAWPADRLILKNEFYMHLKLKDEKERLLCRGGMTCYPSQFDRRVCAVIPGEDDYFAVVHYSVFVNALRARVTVTIECKNNFDHFDAWGTVYASYNNYDYSSLYDEEYYQIVIFDRTEEYRAKVKNCSEIPLSKTLVTTPSECKVLSVDVRLRVRPFKRSMFCFDQFAIGSLEFEARVNACKELPIYRCRDGWASGDKCQQLPKFLCVDDWIVDQPQRGSVRVKVEWF